MFQPFEQSTTISPTITISWTVLAAMSGVFSVIIGIATAYLRLFISVKLADMETKMLAQIKVEFARKDVSDKEIQFLKDRVGRIEQQVESLQDRSHK